MSDSAEVEFEFRTSAAEHQDNWRLNRWRDVKPYDHSRVKLQPTDDEEGKLQEILS